MDVTNLIEAIQAVKENERIARDTYTDAAAKIENPLGKQLFEYLSQFEQFHFDQLEALEKSLQEKGEYIQYEGRKFEVPPLFLYAITPENNKQSVMSIITAALDLETRAERAYAELAEQLADKQGKAMFTRLSQEEHNHYRILSNAYWNLNNLGVWGWEKPDEG